MCPSSMSIPHQVQLFIHVFTVLDKSPHSIHYTKYPGCYLSELEWPS